MEFLFESNRSYNKVKTLSIKAFLSSRPYEYSYSCWKTLLYNQLNDMGWIWINRSKTPNIWVGKKKKPLIRARGGSFISLIIPDSCKDYFLHGYVHLLCQIQIHSMSFGNGVDQSHNENCFNKKVSLTRLEFGNLFIGTWYTNRPLGL